MTQISAVQMNRFKPPARPKFGNSDEAGKKPKFEPPYTSIGGYGGISGPDAHLPEEHLLFHPDANRIIRKAVEANAAARKAQPDESR